MKSLTLLTLFFFSTLVLSAQSWKQYLPKDKLENRTITLTDYQEAFNRYAEPYNVDYNGNYIKDGKKQRLGGWKQFKRWEWEMKSQVDAGTWQFPKTDAWTEWKKYQEKFPDASRSAYGDWVSLGPDYYTGGSYRGIGRLNCIAFHPTDTNTFWVGAPTGGIWKTSDGGTTYTCLGDDIEIMGVSDIIIPDDYYYTQTIYIATGDRDRWENGSVGVLKSIDGGSSWQPTGLSFNRWDDEYVNRLLKHPDYDNIIYAATTDGFYKTTDGGSNFNQISSYSFIDMEFHPTHPDTIYGSTVADFITRVYRTVNGGASWSEVLNVNMASRTELAASLTQPDWLYAIVSNRWGALKSIHKSENSGDTWTMTWDGELPNQNLLGWDCVGSDDNGQGLYDLTIVVDPLDESTVYIGGVNTWKSIDGGYSWDIIAHRGTDCNIGIDTIHADQHFFAFRPGSTALYACNDGGLYKSTDFGTVWTNLSNGLSIGQVYWLSAGQDAYQEILTGYQDVGSKLLSGWEWEVVGGGDGGSNIINPEDYYNQFSTSQFAATIVRTTDHWVTRDYIAGNIPSEEYGCFVSPIMLDPNDPDNLFVCYKDLWKSLDQGDNFYLLHEFPDEDGGITAMDIAPTNSFRMVLATEADRFGSDGNVYRSNNGGNTWVPITGNIPIPQDEFHRINDITIKHNDDDTFWISCGSYDEHGVYETTDGGNTWTNISWGLPDVPVYCIIENTLVSSYTELYCATVMGVFVKLGEQPWLPFNNNLPKVYCKWLDIYSNGTYSKLYVGTFGRGTWESDLYSIETGVPGIWTGIESNNWWDPDNWNYMVLPDASTDVTIPAGCPFNPFLNGSPMEINSLEVDSGAVLSIGDFMLVVNENATIAGTLALYNGTGGLRVKKDLSWESGSSASILADDATIIVEDDWIFKSGSNVELNKGHVYFTGGTYASTISKFGTEGYFNHLVIDKSTPRTVSFSSGSIGDLIINEGLTINADNKFIHNSSQNLELNGTFVNLGEFEFNDGGFIYGGALSVVSGNSNCYFNDLTIDGDAFSYLSLDFNSTVNGDVHIINGALDPLSHAMHVLGNWNNEAGASGFIQTGSNVIFEGASTQTLTNNETFNILTLNNNSPGITIQNGTIECADYDWTSGTLEVNNNGTFIAQDLIGDGIRGNFHVMGTGAIELHNSTTVHLGANITIIGGTFDVYGAIVDSHWPGNFDASLTMTAGEFTIHDVGIYINDDNSRTFTEDITGGTIRSGGDLTIETAEFSPTGGTVALFGTGAASISVDPGISLYNLEIDKASTTFQATSLNAGQKKIANNKKSSPPGNSKKAPPPSSGNRSGSAIVGSDLDILGTLTIESGDFDIGPYTVDVGNGIYIYGTLIMNDPSGTLNSEKSIIWDAGSDANVTDGDITFKDDFKFMDGTDAQLTVNNVVTATGTSGQTLTCTDDNASVRFLVINNTSATVDMFAPTYPFRVSGNLVLNDNTDLLVDDSLLVGAYFNLQDLASATIDGGDLQCSGMAMHGTLDVTDGNARVTQIFLTSSTANLTINGGTLHLDMPYSGSLIDFSGTTNLTDGMLSVTHEGVEITETGTFNFTGGSLHVGYDLKAIYPGTFQPAGGQVMMQNDNNCQIWLSNGNYVPDLYINKSSAGITCTAVDSLVVNGFLRIPTGDLVMNNSYLRVNGYVRIQEDGLLYMGNAGLADVWSYWQNERGDDGFFENGSTVKFLGSNPSTFLTSEKFYNVVLNKTLSPGEYMVLNPGDTLAASNSCQILAGALKLQEDCFLDVDNLEIANGAGLIMEEDQPGIRIEVYGDWTNLNSGFTSSTGFNHQQSTVVFTGHTDQSMVSTGGEEFYRLFIEKISGKFIPENNITVLDSCCLASGVWDYGSTGLSYYFHDDLEIQMTTQWWDSTSHIRFIGEGEQRFTNAKVGGITLWDLIIDQTLGDPGTKVIMEGDVRCRNWAYIIDGVLEMNDATLSVDTRLQVNANGKLVGQPGTTLQLADNIPLLLNSGYLSMNGSESDPCLITHNGSGYYDFNISNGYFEAYWTTIEYTGSDGVYFYNTSLADTNTGFQFCTFRNGITGGTLMQFSTAQVVEFQNVNFPDTPVGGNYNVKKTNNAGNVTFGPAFGLFAGEAYEDDVYGRIDWDLGCEWTGLVSSDWHTVGNWMFDLIPTSINDVLIPGYTPNNPSVINGDPYVRSIFIESGATLTLAGSHDLVVTRDMEIWGTLAFSGNEDFTVQGDMIYQPGSSVNASSTCDINIYGDMIIENGSNLNITGGYTNIRGSTPSHLICLEDSAAVFQLRIMQGAGVPFYFDASSTGDFFINSFFYNMSGNVIFGDSPTKVYLNRSYNNNGGHLYCDSTHFVFSGFAGLSPFKMSPGDYFHDLTMASKTHLNVDLSYSDTVHIKGDLVFDTNPSGSSGIDAHGAYMIIEGDWDNNVGWSAFAHGDNIVEFKHAVNPLSVHGTNNFYGLYDNTSGTSSLKLYDYIEVERELEVDHYVTLYDELFLYHILDLSETSANLVMASGSFAEVDLLSQGGTITCNSGDLYVSDLRFDDLRGTYIINNGYIELQQDITQTIDLAADITMTGGDFHVYGGNLISKWPAQISGNNPVFTMSDGNLYFAHQGIEIENKLSDYNLTENITGGIIRTSKSFYCRGNDTYFSPSGGIIELTGNTNSDCEMRDTGNAFWILKINKTAGATVKNTSEINIQHSLIIQNGTFDDKGNPVNIGP